MESAFVQVNWQDFVCDSSHGTWTQSGNGFHYQPKADTVPACEMDFNTNACTWSFVATNLPAEYARSIYPERGLRITASCRVSDGLNPIELGTRLLAFDEMAASQKAAAANPQEIAVRMRVRRHVGVSGRSSPGPSQRSAETIAP